MKKWDILRVIQGVFIFVIATAYWNFLYGQERYLKPNIIYILADDLGYGELGAYGQEKIETPNIDALAKKGMVFTQHYAGAPVCAPSRYILMTGKHSGHAYIRGNRARPGRDIWNFDALRVNPELEGNLPMPDSTVTIAEELQKAGYKTGVVGKWGLGGPGTEGLPNNQGFDFFYGYLDQTFAHTYYPIYLWRNKKRVFLDNAPVNPHTPLSDSLAPEDPASYGQFQNQPDYSAALMLDEALGFVEHNQEAPFFLYYATPIPHLSLQAPERWIEHYRNKFGDEESYLGENRYVPARFPNATYAAMVSYLDEQVGRIIQKLKNLDLYGNTLIIFTSDNGPAWLGGFDPAYFEAAAPFKGEKGWGKAFLHEGGIRVPMIASWPGVIEAGSKTDHLSAQWDVMPALADIAGAEAPDNIDGISFASVLKGQPSRQKKHDYLYWEFPAYGGQQAVRMGKWKGIRKDIMEKGNLDIALYDLGADIREQKDVADRYPDVVKEIERIMQQAHTTPTKDVFKMEALEREE